MSARVVLYLVAAAGLGWIARGATLGSAAASPSVAPRQIDRCPSPSVIAAVADDGPSDSAPDPDDESTGDDVGALLANLAKGTSATETHNGIHGVVTDQSNGGPLANVTVILLLPNNSAQTTATNTDGEYAFTDLEAGTYTVSFYNNSSGVAEHPHDITVNSFDVASLSERMDTGAAYQPRYEEPEYGGDNE